MENPNTWNDVQRAIDDAIKAYNHSVERGVVGASMVTYIYETLYRTGYLNIPEIERREALKVTP